MFELLTNRNNHSETITKLCLHKKPVWPPKWFITTPENQSNVCAVVVLVFVCAAAVTVTVTITSTSEHTDEGGGEKMRCERKGSNTITCCRIFFDSALCCCELLLVVLVNCCCCPPPYKVSEETYRQRKRNNNQTIRGERLHSTWFTWKRNRRPQWQSDRLEGSETNWNQWPCQETDAGRK